MLVFWLCHMHPFYISFREARTNFRAKLLELMLRSDTKVQAIPLAWVKDLGKEAEDTKVCSDMFPCEIPDLDQMLKEEVLNKY